MTVDESIAIQAEYVRRFGNELDTWRLRFLTPEELITRMKRAIDEGKPIMLEEYGLSELPEGAVT